MARAKRTTKTVAERIMRLSDVDPVTGCRLWRGYIHKRTKYGYITVRTKHTQVVHRAAWEAVHGTIPAGLLVCHKCDVRHCINTDHMFLGTHQDNHDDMVAKGRMRKALGEKNPNSVLTDEQVRQVYLDKRGSTEISREYGISRNGVRRIKKGILRAAALAGLLATAACGTSFKAVDRQPDASLLQPCVDPALAGDNATDNDIAAERIRVAQAYVACKLRHASLSTFVRGGRP